MKDFSLHLRLLKRGRAGILGSMSTKSVVGMILAILFLSLSSCTNESQLPLSSKLYEFPDMSLTEATYVLGRSGEPKLTITAERIEVFEKTERANLTSLTFSQRDEEGELLVSGEADSATVNTKNYDTTLVGNIRVLQKKEDFIIEAEQLLWLNDEQILQSREDVAVRIVFDGGQTLQGSGFKGNLKTGVYEFSAKTEGILIK